MAGSYQLSGKVLLGVNHGKVIVGNQQATVKFVGGTVPDNLGNHIATQDLDMSGFNIENVGFPIYDSDAATKEYVDNTVSGSMSGLDAGDGLGKSGNVIYVGEGHGITVWPDFVSVDETANYSWSGTHDFVGDVLLNSELLETSASEINQALSGIGVTVTGTNLDSLTDGSEISNTLHYHKTKYTTSITNQTSVSINHQLNDNYVVVKCYDASNIEVEPQSVTLDSVNALTLTFGVSFTGSVIILRGY